MPIYEFQCVSCNNKFEILFRTLRRSNEIECPRCKSTEVVRLFSVFGFKSSEKFSSSSGGSCSSCSSHTCATCR